MFTLKKVRPGTEYAPVHLDIALDRLIMSRSNEPYLDHTSDPNLDTIYIELGFH